MPKKNQFFSTRFTKPFPDDIWRATYSLTPAEDLFHIFQTSPNQRRMACEALFNQDTDEAIFFQAQLVAYWAQTDDLNLLWLPDLETIKKAISSLKFPNKLLGQMLVNRLSHKEYDLSLIQGELNRFVNNSNIYRPFFGTRLKLISSYLLQEQKQQCTRSFWGLDGDTIHWLRSLDDLDNSWLAPFLWNAMDLSQQGETLRWILDHLLNRAPETEFQLMISSLRFFRPYMAQNLRSTAVDQCMKRMEEDQSLGSYIAVSSVILVFMDDLEPKQLSLLDEQTDKCLHSNQIALINSAIEVLSIRFPFLEKEAQETVFKRIITLLEEGSHPLIYRYIIDAMPQFLPYLDTNERALFLKSVGEPWVKHASSTTEWGFPVALASSLPHFDDAGRTIVPLLFDELDCESFPLRNTAIKEIKKAFPYIKDKAELEKRFHQLLQILGDKEESKKLRLSALDTLVQSLFLLPNNPQKISMMQQIRNEVMGNRKLLSSFIKMCPDYMAQLPQNVQRMDLVSWLLSQLEHEEEGIVFDVLCVLPLYFSDMREEQKELVKKRFWSFVEQGDFRAVVRYVPFLREEESFNVFKLCLKFWGYSENGDALLTLLRSMGAVKSFAAVNLLLTEFNRPEMQPPASQVILNVMSSFLLSGAPEQLVDWVHEKNQESSLEAMLLKQTTTLLRAPMAPGPNLSL